MIQVESFVRALADRNRLRILNLLLEAGELCVCELTAALELPQPKVSRHLAILRESGVVRDRRQGLWIFYRPHPELPGWGYQALQALQSGCRDHSPYREDLQRLPEVRLENRARAEGR